MANFQTERFEFFNNQNPVSSEKLNLIHSELKFGKYMTDHMVHIRFKANDGLDEHSGVGEHNGTWEQFEVIPYGPISLMPAAGVLHYGQSIFEGLKAYIWADGSVNLFRPELNAERFRKSAIRLGLPPLSVQDFLDSLAALLKVDSRWIPKGENESLYLRPLEIGSEAFLGVRPAHIVDYYLIASPVGAYFGTAKPVKIWLETEFHRAGKGGTGEAKCGGNYAASLLPAMNAFEKGCSQVLYLDSSDASSIEELGGMSFFVVYKDGSIVTPELNGNVLNSVTRRSIIELLKSENADVKETNLTIDTLVKQVENSEVEEAFACGTAAVVSPIGEIINDSINLKISETEGEVTKHIRETLVGIQTGKVEDKFNWMVKVNV